MPKLTIKKVRGASKGQTYDRSFKTQAELEAAKARYESLGMKVTQGKAGIKTGTHEANKMMNSVQVQKREKLINSTQLASDAYYNKIKEAHKDMKEGLIDSARFKEVILEQRNQLRETIYDLKDKYQKLKVAEKPEKKDVRKRK